MIGAAPTGFEQQFQQFVYYAGPILQLVYWLAMIVAALWAVALFKRWVEFQTGAAGGEAVDAEVSSAGVKVDEAVKVEDFVE